MLRVFGCMCMALVPKHLRHNKLGAKAIWAVHLGMAQNSKGWLLWDPFTKKFLVSRDCKFMENLMYKDWKAENEAKIGMRFGEVKSSGLEHVELPLELSSSSTTTRQSSLVNGGEEAKDAEEEEEEVQQAAMDAEMASWKSTSTYVDEVPPCGANIVSGMWIFRVKRPPGSSPAFKARYVARGFSQRQGVDYFQTFSPTPKMTTLRVLLHVAAQRDYELHSLDFSTAFLQGSLHEEIRLRRPPGFTGSFPPGTQWSLRRPVYGLRQAPRQWHDTLRTTLAALGFAPSTADPSLFLRIDTSLPPFYVLVYVDDLVFATADTAGLAHVKSELQKRHTCTDLGELRSYLGLQITRDRAQRTITLTQSHMVQQVLQRFDFTYSSPQATPLSTCHSLSALPSDESVEPSGPRWWVAAEAAGTLAAGATGTLASGATGTRATGVTGSVAKRAAGATDSRATGATSSRATGATISRATGAAEFTATTPLQLPPFPQTSVHTPQHPYRHSIPTAGWCCRSPPPHCCTRSRGMEEKGEGVGGLVLQIPSPPLLHPQQEDGGEGGAGAADPLPPLLHPQQGDGGKLP
ncbi:unnamed protein product [Closterium sp. NIES-54]